MSTAVRHEKSLDRLLRTCILFLLDHMCMCTSSYIGVIAITGDAAKVTTKKRLEDFMEEPMRNRDVIALAKFPDSHQRDTEAPLPIEREDWPAPAAAAAAYPELRTCDFLRRLVYQCHLICRDSVF